MKQKLFIPRPDVTKFKSKEDVCVTKTKQAHQELKEFSYAFMKKHSIKDMSISTGGFKTKPKCFEYCTFNFTNPE